MEGELRLGICTIIVGTTAGSPSRFKYNMFVNEIVIFIKKTKNSCILLFILFNNITTLYL